MDGNITRRGSRRRGAIWLCLWLAFGAAARAQDDNQEASVAQQTEAVFPGRGRAVIRILEKEGEAPTLEIASPERRWKPARFVMGRGDDFYVIHSMDSAVRCQARFRVLNVAGLPQPLIAAVAVTPGGSGHGFTLELIGLVGGKFERLSRKPLYTSNIGGFHIGPLGDGRIKVTVWDFIWANDEAHYDPHRYEFELYGFNPKTKRLFLMRRRRSTQKYDHPNWGKDAAREFGLEVRNLLEEIPDFKTYVSEDEPEEETPEGEEGASPRP